MKQDAAQPETSPHSRELFRLIVENIKDYAVFMTDADGRIISWNPGVGRVLGYAENEIVGEPVTVIFTAEDAAAGAHLKEMETARRTGCSEDKRWHVRKDGSLFWANGMVMPVKDDDGGLRGFAKVMRDDTAQKNAEEKLEQTNRRLNSILSSLNDSFYTFDREFRYLYVNEATTRMFDLPEADFLGKTLWEIFPDADGNIFHREVRRALDERTNVVFENYYAPLDRWFENRVYASADGLSVFTTEITERKRAEALLSESEERYRTLFDSIDEGFCTIEVLFDENDNALDYRFLEINPAFEKLTGISAIEARRGKTIREMVPNLEDKWVEIYGRVALTGEAVRFVEGSEALNRWFDVYAFRTGAAENRRVAILFNNITTRRQAEENLEHQKTLLEALTESVLDGIVILSNDGRLLHFNQQFLDIWNFPAEVIDAKSDELALQWAAGQTLNPAEFLARVNAVYGQPDANVREELPMKDGRVYERFGAPIFSGERRLGWVWTFRNITARKRTEANLAFLAEISQELARLSTAREIIEAASSGIGKFLGVSNCIFAEIDTAANTAHVNYGWRAGDDAVDLIGSYRLSRFVSDDYRRTLTAGQAVVVRDVAREPLTAGHQAEFRQLKIGSFVNTPYIGDGDLKFILGVYRSEPYDWRADEIALLGELLTRARTHVERARAEENLRESEARFRHVADAAPVLIWISDTTKQCTWFNKMWLEFTGQTLERECGGDGWTDGIHAEDFDRARETYFAAFEGRESFSLEYRRRHRGGEYCWLLDNGVPRFAPDGDFLGYIGSCVDIDARKRSETEREKLLESEQESRRQAENANRLKDEFLATLSHELRTPLNAILGWSQVLQSRSLGEIETVKALATIERNARAQSQLIDDILDVSRIVTGKLRLDVRAVDLADVITAAAEAARPAAEAKDIRLQILLDPQAGVISGDPNRLQQIVWNLLSNAVKFTPKGGRVQIRLERVNSHVEIVLSDTGKGIEAEFLPFVFDRFRQSDGSMTRRHGGLGLGLAIVRQLVELHGGTASVESAGAGQGATFRVNLPLLPVRSEPETIVPRVHPRAETGAALDCPPELSGLRVLLVDDEADSRELLELVLNSCGAWVAAAASAAEAFELIQTMRFDVLISDIGMPDEDGFSLVGKIRKLPKERGGRVPAAALTAYARAEDRVQALRAGFQMHVAKPVEPSELVAVIANLAERGKNPNS